MASIGKMAEAQFEPLGGANVPASQAPWPPCPAKFRHHRANHPLARSVAFRRSCLMLFGLKSFALVCVIGLGISIICGRAQPRVAVPAQRAYEARGVVKEL